MEGKGNVGERSGMMGSGQCSVLDFSMESVGAFGPGGGGGT